jgi:DNA polymerase-1
LPINIDVNEFLIKPPDMDSLEKIINKYELKSLSNQLKIKTVKKKTKKNYELVTSIKMLKQVIDECIKTKIFSFDTETTSLDFNEAELVGFSISYMDNHGFYCPLGHNSDADKNIPFDKAIKMLKELFEHKELTVVGQNFKYDMNVVKKYSINFKTSIEDTMLMSYVLNSGGKHDLGTLASKFLDHEAISYEDVVGKGKDQITFADVDMQKAVTYACEDSDLTLLLYGKLKSKLLKDKRLYDVYRNIEIKLMLIIAEMEYLGVSIDNKELDKQSNNLKKRIDKIEKQIYSISGREFNISSPKQIQEIFYDELKLPVLKKTPKGQPSTNEDVMTQLAENHELPSLILSFRNLLNLKILILTSWVYKLALFLRDFILHIIKQSQLQEDFRHHHQIYKIYQSELQMEKKLDQHLSQDKDSSYSQLIIHKLS